MNIRKMLPEDWPAVAAIYRMGIATGLATFDTVCPEYEAWNAGHLPQCRLVMEAPDGAVMGWAALSPFSARPAYRGVAEASLYMDAACTGRGAGTALLASLVWHSEEAGIWTVQSLIMEENRASLRMHEKCGFRTVGLRERIGCDENGKWRNCLLVERRSSQM